MKWAHAGRPPKRREIGPCDRLHGDSRVARCAHAPMPRTGGVSRAACAYARASRRLVAARPNRTRFGLHAAAGHSKPGQSTERSGVAAAFPLTKG
ncbi:hypothetical protein AQ932_25785 [Burkholderia pseudomallei]|nr:hypothetical protein AQ854_16490 [Burkholderia pseudomallei]OMY95413.1 hypothetical protein AQ855_16910 [Burkholderia pseudomallei]OMZ12052.1 hypothetical protein AQ856_17495 [Burkholderia pseudomallei]OMZ79544.1 hypothetical protein AQ870_16275 [Burkholderia pseudomallei]OND28327.1 hypothetical protein AQ931_19585 [Burkholderia pseudomallei]